MKTFPLLANLLIATQLNTVPFSSLKAAEYQYGPERLNNQEEGQTQTLQLPPLSGASSSKPSHIKEEVEPEEIDSLSKKNDSAEAIPDWLVRWEIARVLTYQNKYDEAIEEYRHLIHAKPNLVEPRVELATIFFYKKQPEITIQILNQIPTSQWNDAAKVLMANIYASEGQYQKAEPLYLAYLAKNPGDLKTRFKYAEMLSWQKRYPESIREYQKLIQKRPDDIQLRRKYAFVLIWMGRQEEGIEELRATLNHQQPGNNE